MRNDNSDLIWFLAFTIIIFGVQAVICFLLQRCFQKIPEHYRRMQPGMVWLLMIPCFNLVWNFFVYPRLSQSFVAYFRAYRAHEEEYLSSDLGKLMHPDGLTFVGRILTDPGDVGDCAEGLGWAFSTCMVAACIPYVGCVAGVAALVILIIYLVKVIRLKRFIIVGHSWRSQEENKSVDQQQPARPKDRKGRLEENLRQMSGRQNAFDMLMWRLANAALDGESEEVVLEFLESRIVQHKAPRDQLRPLLREAIEEFHSSPEYMAPSFTNLSRYDKDEPSPRVEEPAAPEPVLLRCNNCGATQRKGDWEKAMDARAKAMGSRGFVNLSASPQCLNCSSTDLVDAASPKPPPKAFPKEAEELTTQMMTAAREWEAAHTEAQGAVHLSSDEFREVSRRTGAVKDEMEKLVARLIAEARAKNILDDVLSLLQEKGARAALYIVDHYL